MKLETVANLATAASVLIAVVAFFIQTWLEKKKRKLEQFDRLEEQWRSFLELSLQYPELLFNSYFGDPSLELDEMQRRQRVFLFEICVSLFESAYLAHLRLDGYRYRDERYEFLGKNDGPWKAWLVYIKTYCGSPVFVELWSQYGWGYDETFTRFIDFYIHDIAYRRARLEEEAVSVDQPTQQPD